MPFSFFAIYIHQVILQSGDLSYNADRHFEMSMKTAAWCATKCKLRGLRANEAVKTRYVSTGK